ncbi:hypothetical protein OU993_19890 [Rhizobium sp. SL86]|nr:hypothetical protein [Rhizobium sp. SL86]MCY1667702.1 hypothetical protein [Rhizobium sp. SL86]
MPDPQVETSACGIVAIWQARMMAENGIGDDFSHCLVRPLRKIAQHLRTGRRMFHRCAPSCDIGLKGRIIFADIMKQTGDISCARQTGLLAETAGKPGHVQQMRIKPLPITPVSAITAVTKVNHSPTYRSPP